MVVVLFFIDLKYNKGMSKSTVVLVHGYNGVPKIFEYFRDVLEQRGYEVIIPSFPTREDITKDKYFSVFDKYRDKLSEDTIIIAHSIGNIMTLKYLCANNIEIRGYISLAGFGKPFSVEGRDDLNGVIALLKITDDELKKIPTLIGKAYSFYSDNDHIVPLEILKEHPKIIGAEDCFISGIGHMGKKSGLEEFPEVIDVVNFILSLNKKYGTEIAHITEADLGLETPSNKPNNRKKLDVRILLENEKGEICVVKSLKKNYIQIPGGGVEDGETLEEAARRETREEVGYEITDLKPLGYVIEERYGLTGDDAEKSFVFAAKAGKDVGTDLTEEEKEEGFTPVWMTVDKAFKTIEKKDRELENTSQDKKSYNGTFANRRDLIIIRHIYSLKNTNK